MSTLFPDALDDFSNPTPSTSQSAGPRTHSQQHSDLNDAVEAMQARIGITGSTDPASLEYKQAIMPSDFGAVGDGVNDDTTALFDFFTACITTGKRGYIGPGTYLITEGVLAFDTPFVDAVWPIIDTAGHQAVIFKAAGAADLPLFSLTNGTASSGVGKYWRGGSLGGITFDDDTGDVAPNRHGILLRGVWQTQFGHMVGNDLRGSLVYVAQALYAGTNPDPYAVSLCGFVGIEANRCAGWACYNGNWAGFTGCTIEFLRAIECESGGYYGFGAANTVRLVSMGSCGGWAFDDGTNIAATGGANVRFIVEQAELDDVENGIRLNRCSLVSFREIRFNHRYNFSHLNPAGGYWPRVAIDLGGGGSSNVAMVGINAVHRIEAGGAKVDMGVLVNGHSDGGLSDIDIDFQVLDNAGFGFVNSDYFTGMNATAPNLKLRVLNRLIYDSSIIAGSLARGDGTTTILNGGYSTAANKVLFPSELYDRGSYYDGADEFVCPYDGVYFAQGQFHLTAAAGTKVQLGICRDRGGTLALHGNRIQYQQTANAESYATSAYVICLAGDKLSLMAAQNSGAPIVVTVSANQAADNFFNVSAIKG